MFAHFREQLHVNANEKKSWMVAGSLFRWPDIQEAHGQNGKAGRRERWVWTRAEEKGGEWVRVGMCPWEISRRGSLHSHIPYSVSICYCYLLEAILGSWNASVNNTDKVKQECSCLLCTSYFKAGRPTINNKCSIMNLIIYWDMRRRKHREYFKIGLRHETQMY